MHTMDFNAESKPAQPFSKEAIAKTAVAEPQAGEESSQSDVPGCSARRPGVLRMAAPLPRLGHP